MNESRARTARLAGIVLVSVFAGCATGELGIAGADGGSGDAGIPTDAPTPDVRGTDAGPAPDAALPAEPLVVHPDNARYFARSDGRAVRLAGHQIFVDLQDNSFNKPTTYGDRALLDWAWYLDFAVERHLNLIRNWVIWSFGSGSAAAPDRIARPMMYARTGPGTAADGQPKLDLDTFDDAFFDRLRTRVGQAGTRGIYVTVMLFEVYGFGDGESTAGDTLWDGNVFNGNNNVQGIDVDANGDGWGMEFFYTSDARVLDLQRAYVDRVVDTLNDLDNVIYEVANELYAPAWQAEVVRRIHGREATMPKQHLVYMSPGGRDEDGSWRAHAWSDLTGSGAEVLGIAESFGDFANDPPAADGVEPLIWDNDHVWGADWQHRRRAWMAFTRGYHFILYDAPFETPAMESADFETMRYNIGATVAYGERFADLARMNPRGDLTSTGYCLADPGAEYLVYQPVAGTFTVDLEAGDFAFEWFDLSTHAVTSTGTVSSAGGTETFDPPSGLEDAVLYLRAL